VDNGLGYLFWVGGRSRPPYVIAKCVRGAFFCREVADVAEKYIKYIKYILYFLSATAENSARKFPRGNIRPTYRPTTPRGPPGALGARPVTWRGLGRAQGPEGRAQGPRGPRAGAWGPRRGLEGRAREGHCLLGETPRRSARRGLEGRARGGGLPPTTPRGDPPPQPCARGARGPRKAPRAAQGAASRYIFQKYIYIYINFIYI